MLIAAEAACFHSSMLTPVTAVRLKACLKLNAYCIVHLPAGVVAVVLAAGVPCLGISPPSAAFLRRLYHHRAPPTSSKRTHVRGTTIPTTKPVELEELLCAAAAVSLVTSPTGTTCCYQ